MKGLIPTDPHADFPEDFKAPEPGTFIPPGLADNSPEDLHRHFLEQQRSGRLLLTFSDRKQCVPRSFIKEDDDTWFTVGWHSEKFGQKSLRRFFSLADAATDYVLFSFGKCRFNPSEHRLGMNWYSPIPLDADFPEDFEVQQFGLQDLINRQPEEIATYFRENPGEANYLIDSMNDIRWCPSAFLGGEGNYFEVGWVSDKFGKVSIRHFSTLADAATDYVLFSFGKCRWNPSK